MSRLQEENAIRLLIAIDLIKWMDPLLYAHNEMAKNLCREFTSLVRGFTDNYEISILWIWIWNLIRSLNQRLVACKRCERMLLCIYEIRDYDRLTEILNSARRLPCYLSNVWHLNAFFYHCDFCNCAHNFHKLRICCPFGSKLPLWLVNKKRPNGCIQSDTAIFLDITL